jgi:hypothetical protein
MQSLHREAGADGARLGPPRIGIFDKPRGPLTPRLHCGMADRMPYPEADPRHHTVKIKSMLGNVAPHARADISKIKEPRAQALFETTDEVLIGPAKGIWRP